MTNAHVVGNASSFQVLQADSVSPQPATLVGRYRPDDLAGINVSGAENLRPAGFGDSAKLEIGNLILAIGNPLGLTSSWAAGRPVTLAFVSYHDRLVWRTAGVLTSRLRSAAARRPAPVPPPGWPVPPSGADRACWPGRR